MSQIATTIKQSKRLLAAGIDPKSADMCYIEEIITNGIGCVPYKRAWSEYPCVDTHEEYEGAEPVSLPAWSLARLWDMYRLRCGREFMITSVPAKELFEVLIERLI